MAIDKVYIVNDALGRFGASTVDLEVDNSRADRLNKIYNGTMAFAFGLHVWTMLKATVKCDLIDKVSNGVDASGNWPNGFAYAHEKPGNLVGAVRKISSSSQPKITNFELEGSWVYTNEPEIWIAGRFSKTPELWPDAWREAFTVLLAGEFAVPESANEELENKFLTRALGTPSQRNLPGGMFGRLVAQDLAENPPDSPFRGGDILTDARQSGGNWHGRF